MHAAANGSSCAKMSRPVVPGFAASAAPGSCASVRGFVLDGGGGGGRAPPSSLPLGSADARATGVCKEVGAAAGTGGHEGPSRFGGRAGSEEDEREREEEEVDGEGGSAVCADAREDEGNEQEEGEEEDEDEEQEDETAESNRGSVARESRSGTSSRNVPCECTRAEDADGVVETDDGLDDTLGEVGRSERKV